jgi:putative spermidine/putrescine transport system ATP-binding protein
MLTRYVVTLDAGGQLTAVRQNLDGYAADVAGDRGVAVTVAWPGQQSVEITRDQEEQA